MRQLIATIYIISFLFLGFLSEKYVNTHRSRNGIHPSGKIVFGTKIPKAKFYTLQLILLVSGAYFMIDYFKSKDTKQKEIAPVN